LESRRSRRGPINIALLSLQGGRVAVKGEELGKHAGPAGNQNTVHESTRHVGA